MSLLIPGTNSIKDTGYDVANSLRFDDGSSDYLSRTPSSSGNTKTWTFSTWIKRAGIGLSAPMNVFGGEDGASRYSDVMIGTPSGADDTFWFKQDTGTVAELRSTAILRDPTAWYHLVFVYDSTNGTADDRMKMYVNGVQLTSFVTRTNVGSNVDSYVNSSGDINYVGSYQGSSKFLDGYLCETALIDGTALTPTSFGEFDSDTGIWKPKDFKDDVTFGTNGFYLEYKESGTGTDSSGMGADTSGNNHHFAVSNLTSVDQCTDTCTNNFCTLNPLINSGGIYSDGNCKLNGGLDNKFVWGTMATSMNNSSAGWYYEVKIEHTPDSTNGLGIRAGCGSITFANEQSGGMGTDGGFGLSNDTAKLIQNSSSVYQLSQNGGANSINSSISTANGHIVNVAWKNGKTFYGVNGVYVANDGGSDGNPSSDTNQSYDIVSSVQGDFWNPILASSGSAPSFVATVGVNFGNPTFSISSGNADANGYGNFEYAPPTGFYAICSKNLAEYG